jgi:hypothetical protein
MPDWALPLLCPRVHSISVPPLLAPPLLRRPAALPDCFRIPRCRVPEPASHSSNF